MNILHHKSWHVRTKKNIEKVRKDEQNALIEQTEKARKADIAEQERRIQQLRNKFNLNQELDQYELNNQLDKKDNKINNQFNQREKNQHQLNKNNQLNRREKNQLNQQQSNKEHLNLFQPEYEYGKNRAHELEKKIEQEQWEKKVGILTYLGGNDKNNDLPWYEKLSKQDKQLNYKDISVLEYNDPLNKIKKELKKRKEDELKLNNLLDKRIKLDDKFRKDKRIEEFRKAKQKNEFRKDKKIDELNKREKEKLNSINELDKTINKTELTDKQIKLNELREKRLKRELKESKRSKNLFINTGLFNHCLDDRERPYYNRFNQESSRNSR